MRWIALAFALLATQAQAQTTTFSNYLKSLPGASTPFVGTEQLYVLQGGLPRQAPASAFAALSGTVTNGDLIAGGPGATQVQDTSALANSPGYATLPSGLRFTANIIYAGASAPGNSWLSADSVTLSGTASNNADGRIAANYFFISADTVDTTTSGGGFLDGFLVAHRTSAGSTGGRTAIEGFENIIGTPTTVTSAGYLAIYAITRVGSGFGGTGGAYANGKGTAFAGTSNVFTSAAATNLLIINAHEFDVSVVTGASTSEKHGISIVQSTGDAVQGTYDDSAIDINNAAGSATGWNYGISFGDYAHLWPFTTSSTLIGAQIRQTVPSSPVALYGIDFRNVTFQGGGLAFASTGWNVDPSGNETAVSFRLGSTSSASGNGLYLSATNTPSISVNGVISQTWSVNNSLFSVVNNGTAAYSLRNTQTLSNAAMALNIGNDTAAGEFSVTVNSSTNAAGNGANSATIVGASTLWLKGGSTNGVEINGSGVVILPNVATGTPAASLCIDASNNIIKKTTTGPCV